MKNAGKFAILLLMGIGTAVLKADDASVLTNDSIIQMVKWHIGSTEIIAAIGKSETKFELSPATVKLLKINGVTDNVLAEMWKGTLKSSAYATVPMTTLAVSQPAAPKYSAARARELTASSPERLTKASRETAETVKLEAYSSSCSEKRRVELDWESGSVSPSIVDKSRRVCFELKHFNDILYTADFSLQENQPSGSAFDLLKDIISTLSGISLGTSSTDNAKVTEKAAKQAGPAGVIECPKLLADHVQKAVDYASQLQDDVDRLAPIKDDGGKYQLVLLGETLQKWQPIPDAYDQFQVQISNVIKDLRDPNADVCNDELLQAAEAVILDTYVPIRKTYPTLEAHALSDHVERFESDLDAVSGYDLTVTAKYSGTDVVNGSKKFSLRPGRKILTSSVGFLVTELPARSYSSVTAPSGLAAPNPATQNVLGVNYFNGPRVALTGLLNMYVPRFNSRLSGLALSAGPVFDISNGKADTSRLGLFAGPTIHIRNQFFLTPGVHFGEFADFPQGFIAAGQVIPANLGTPTPTKRYTARFGFAITYKLKDLGEAATKADTATPTANKTDNKGAGVTHGVGGTAGSKGSVGNNAGQVKDKENK